MVDGKAKVLDETLCDGAGFCIPVCPPGALTVEVREAPDFNEEKAEEQMRERGRVFIAQKCFRCDTGEEQVYLIPFRRQGNSQWVCTRCLPGLIHG
jgi:Fe-S-cluster-containing hydrogenase component 2